MSQLPADCINEIFEHLEDDDATLYSCLLVNRLWCKISVRILWRNIRNYNTLIACLPNESKEILYNNKIIFQPQLQTLQYLIMHHFVKLYQLMLLNTIFRSFLMNN